MRVRDQGLGGNRRAGNIYQCVLRGHPSHALQVQMPAGRRVWVRVQREGVVGRKRRPLCVDECGDESKREY